MLYGALDDVTSYIYIYIYIPRSSVAIIESHLHGYADGVMRCQDGKLSAKRVGETSLPIFNNTHSERYICLINYEG